MKNKYALLLIVFSMAAWSGCKDCDDPTDPDCGNYDPCFGQQEFVPHFKMYDAISHWSGEELALPGSNAINNYIMIEGDTLLTRRVIFIAPEEYDSVWWRIGAEASYRQGKGVRIFFEDLYPENLPIIMIGKRQPNVACFSNEQAIDTVQRFLTLKPRTDTKVTGQWIGAYDTHPDDSFEINIRFPKGHNYGIAIDYFPNRDLSPNSDGSPTQGSSYPVSLNKFWSSFSLTTSMASDRYGRRYRMAYINGEVYGNNYQYLKIALKYSYDSDPTFELLPLTFNARRK